MLDELPDGIHSGLVRDGRRGLFFYFTSPGPRGQGRQHFWRYYDLHEKRVLDNRYLIANLIACAEDTPRVVGDADVFEIQEKVIEHILAQSVQQKAIEEAPTIVDPVQQTVATVLRGYLNHPDVDRQQTRKLIQSIVAPLPRVYVRSLRGAYQDFTRNGQDVQQLIAALQSLPLASSSASPSNDTAGAASATPPLQREDLHLVCFDYVWS